MQLILSFRFFFGLRGGGHIYGLEKKMVKKVLDLFLFVKRAIFCAGAVFYTAYILYTCAKWEERSHVQSEMQSDLLPASLPSGH